MKKPCDVLLILYLLIASSVFIRSECQAQEIFPIRLSMLDGTPASLTPQKSHPYTVLAFLLPDCPACQSYSKTLNTLQDKYGKSGVRVIGVFAGKFSKPDDMVAYSKEYAIRFPLYCDTDHSLIRNLSISVSPEVAVIGPSGAVLYSGRIDDWMYAIGKKRTVIRHHDLEDAIRMILQGKQPQPNRTTPIGCIIEG